MANKPLQSMTFPWLSDTYTIPIVDSALSSSSENPVQNKAIAGQLEYTNEFAYSGISLDNIGLTKGKYINASTGANVSNNDHWASGLIPVVEGMVFEYRLAATEAAAVIIGYALDGSTAISGSSVAGAGYGTAVYGTYTVPSGVSNIRVCTLKWDDNVSSPSGKIFGVFFRLAGSTETSRYFARISDFPWVGNRVITENGSTVTTVNDNENYKATVDYLKVSEGDIIEYSLSLTVNWTIIAFYDEFKNLVNRPVVGTGSSYAGIKHGIIKIPSGVEYVRFSYAETFDGSVFAPGNMGSLYSLRIYPEEKEVVQDLNLDAVRAIQSARKYDFVQEQSSSLVQPVSLIHFSDIHGTPDVLERIVQFKEINKRIVYDAICTGDMVQASTAANGMTFWDEVDGAEAILTTIGNHDNYTGSGTLSMQEQYDMYIAPYKDKWGAVTVANKPWWYKDYTANKLRLIGLGSSYLMPSSDMSDMVSWLASVLDDAKNNDYSVVIAQHYKPSDFIYVESDFTQFYGRLSGDLFVDDSILTAVDSFIQSGGDFVCHLCGHTHQDQIVYSVSHPKQLFVCVTTASSDIAQEASSDLWRQYGEKSLDAFNVVTIDTNRHLLKITRIGADVDMIQRNRKTITINYSDFSSYNDAPDLPFHKASLAWEAGGIDNATGETNNDGSVSRSRVVEYFPVTELYSITNNTGNALWIIYYTYSNGSYTFVSSESVGTGTTHYFENSNYYVRFDCRAALNTTKNGTELVEQP